MRSHAAGWTSDSPTPAQLKELFAQIESGKVTNVSLQRFLRGGIGQPDPYLTESEQMALKILGTGKVIGYQKAISLWGFDLPKIVPTMACAHEVLEACAGENKSGYDWRLVWVNGLSLRQQEQIRGRNRMKQPCFDPDYTWWLEKAQDNWANQLVGAGYRLFDFSGRFSNMRWSAQNDAIAQLGDCYERAEEQAVSESCLTFFLASGDKKERLLQNFYHWGHLLTSNGDHVCVGYFDESGFDVDDYWDDSCSDSLQVVLSRKF